MTLQDWSNLAQVIGALAVVISLVYLGFQDQKERERRSPRHCASNSQQLWRLVYELDARCRN
jgi:aspartate/tyrosine/aromatic aminotransferase